MQKKCINISLFVQVVIFNFLLISFCWGVRSPCTWNMLLLQYVVAQVQCTGKKYTINLLLSNSLHRHLSSWTLVHYTDTFPIEYLSITQTRLPLNTDSLQRHFYVNTDPLHRHFSFWILIHYKETFPSEYWSITQTLFFLNTDPLHRHFSFWILIHYIDTSPSE